MEVTDIYAAGKANLRDTIKWMAATCAALLAIVLAGTPFSGFGKLDPGTPRFLIAAISIMGASGVLLALWCILIRLLRSDAFFPGYLADAFDRKTVPDKGDLKEIEAVRDHIRDHAADFFPKDAPSMDRLKASIEEEWNSAQEQPAEVSDRWKVYEELSARARQTIDYASFERLRYRLKQATWKIIILTGLAAVLLFAFAWASNPSKADPQGGVQIVQTVPEPDLPSIFAPVVFQLGQSTVDAAGRESIMKVRDFLRANSASGVLLFAHTDTMGTAAFNKALAQSRGAAVRKILIEQAGISPTRIFVSELPQTDLAKLTAAQVPERDNRTVDFFVVRLPSRN